MSVELSGKRLELLAEVVPGLKRVAVLTTASNFTATGEYKEMEGAARVLGAKLQIQKARDPDTIDSAFLAMSKERAQSLVVIPNARYAEHRERILKHVAKNRLPSIYSHNEDVENGGLMSYGVNYAAEYRRTAIYRRQDPERCQAGRSARRTADQIRVHHQSESRQADRPDDSAQRAGEGG